MSPFGSPAWATLIPRVAHHARSRATHTTFTALRPICTAAAPSPPSAAADARNADPAAVAVVIGGSRGIGLAITQALLTRWAGRVIATARKPDNAGALNALWQFAPNRFSTVPLDVCDEQSIVSAADEVKKVGDEPRIDLLIHCAGILHEDSNMPETSLSKVTPDFIRRTIDVNLVGPVLVAKHFSPLMTTTRKENRVPSILATLSARVGSISDNNLGGWLSYRASKAGQNQAMRTISIELARRGVIVTSLHPGTVATDLSAPFQKRVPASQLQDPAVAAGRLLDVIDSLTPQDTGGFFAYDGTVVPY